MDLRRQPPRRPSNLSVAGMVGVARMADKARAHNNGTLGEYVYGDNSGLDRKLLSFLGLSAADFAKAAAQYDDVKLGTWMLEKSKKTQAEIGAFNKTELSKEPETEEAKARLAARIKQFAPGRTDIKTALQSMELDDWGNFWKVDLTKQPPRSPHCQDVAGIVGVARMADKARAWKAGLLGEYKYGNDSGLDRVRTLPFLGISAEEFAEAAVNNPNDLELGEWLLKRTGKTKAEIETHNHTQQNRSPQTDEDRLRFETRLKNADPARTDIKTWFDLLDLEDRVGFNK